MHSRLREFAAYTAASAIALACDVGLLVLLVERFHIHYVGAASLSFTAGSCIAYALSVRFAFDFRRIESAKLELAVFIAIGVIGLALNAGVMFACVEWGGQHYLVAKGAAGVLSFAFNYTARRILLFTRPRSSDHAD
jgi:putative flippase GtrA